MKKKLPPRLSQILYKHILLYTAGIFLASLLLSTALVYHNLEDDSQKKAAMINATIVHFLEVQDQAHLILEKTLQADLEHWMPAFQESYLANLPSPENIDLAALKQAAGGRYDFFLIDNNNIIRYTTFTPDIDLDFNRLDQVATFLQHVRNSPDIQSERATFTERSTVKKFIYQRTRDLQYILEIGIAIDDAHQALTSAGGFFFDSPTYFDDLKRSNPLIRSISIYDHRGRPQYTTDPQWTHQQRPLRKSVLRGNLSNHNPVFLEKDNIRYYYTLFNPAGSHIQGYASKVIEVAIDTTSLKESVQQIIALPALLILLGLSLALAVGSLFLRRITQPLNELATDVEQISAGLLDKPIPPTEDFEEVFILSASIETMRQKLEQQLTLLSLQNEELEQSYHYTIQGFFRTLTHREPYTAAHSLGVNFIAVAIGREMKLSGQQLFHLDRGSLLHDIGKLAISDTLLLKTYPLTAAELRSIRQHPLVGFDVLPKMPSFLQTAAIVKHHHEHFDGNGYPDGLAGDAIPLLARICSVADTVHAMTSDRPYRQALPWSLAVEEVTKFSGSQFDPAVVEAFRIIEKDLEIALYKPPAT